jgi:hypothetical protein
MFMGFTSVEAIGESRVDFLNLREERLAASTLKSSEA